MSKRENAPDATDRAKARRFRKQVLWVIVPLAVVELVAMGSALIRALA